MSLYVPFSINTADHLYIPEVQSVQDFKIAPWISDKCLADILKLDREDTGDKAKELFAFWRDYVRPYAVLQVFVQMINTQGLNWGSNGIVTFADRDNTSAQISDTQRDMFAKKYRQLLYNYETRLLKKFSALSGTFDNVVYEVDNDRYRHKRASPAGISAIGRVNDGDLVFNRKFRL